LKQEFSFGLNKIVHYIPILGILFSILCKISLT